MSAADRKFGRTYADALGRLARGVSITPRASDPASATCDACEWSGDPALLLGHPADDFPYDWMLCPDCRKRDPRELLRAEVGS